MLGYEAAAAVPSGSCSAPVDQPVTTRDHKVIRRSLKCMAGRDLRTLGTWNRAWRCVRRLTPQATVSVELPLITSGARDVDLHELNEKLFEGLDKTPSGLCLSAGLKKLLEEVVLKRLDEEVERSFAVGNLAGHLATSALFRVALFRVDSGGTRDRVSMSSEIASGASAQPPVISQRMRRHSVTTMSINRPCQLVFTELGSPRVFVTVPTKVDRTNRD